MYEEYLKEFGLTDNESKIYLLLLTEGAINPGEISQKLGLHRGYVYDALERMQEKEVVSSVILDGKKNFQAVRPESLIELLKFKLERFQKVLPELNKLEKNQKEDTKVELHKGKRVYRTLLKDLIANVKKGEEVLLIGVDEKTLITQIEPIYLKQYFNTIKTKKISERVIIKKGSTKVKFANIKHKEIDEKYIGNTELIIYSNKVARFIIGSPHHLIIIQNKEVADTERKKFELLWQVSK